MEVSHLSTDAEGSIQMRVGEAILSLGEQSSVLLHRDGNAGAKDFEAELLFGTAVLSASAVAGAEIEASSARVRPIGKDRAVVQVRLIGPRELIVFARRGPAEITYRGESETIAEGKSYRVLLNADEDGTSGGPGEKEPERRNKTLLLIAAGAAGATVIPFGGEK